MSAARIASADGRVGTYRATAELREFRLRLGLSQTELGERARIPQGQVSRIERGDVAIRRRRAARLAEALGLSLPQAIERDLIRISVGGEATRWKKQTTG